MSAFVPARFTFSQRLLTILRLALRDLRGGVRGFGVFLSCLAIGVAAIAGVGSLSRALSDGLAREGAVILGGDVAFSLALREATDEQKKFFASRGTVSEISTMRAMARTPEGDATLVDLKAVDRVYPLTGAVTLSPAMPLNEALTKSGETFGGVADEALFVRLGLKPGSILRVGEAQIRISGQIVSEPDKLSVGMGLAPRLLISEEAINASGLVQPGSVMRSTYRVRLIDRSEASLAAITEEAKAKFPDAGWEMRTRAGAAPRLEDSVRRFAEFLTLVGLTALLVGGVGVANAVKHYLDRKRESLATLKALGASGGTVFAVYLAEIGMIAIAGIAIGLVIGVLMPFAAAWAFAQVIPVPLQPAIYPTALLIALAYGMLVVLVFSLWPLGRAHDVPVSALFRDEVEPDRRLPRRRYILLAAIAATALVALTIGSAEVQRVAIIYVVAAVAVFVVLRLLAAGLMALAKRLPRPRSIPLRLAISNIHRPGALTPTVVLSLGLGLSLLVTLALIEGNMQRQLTGTLPERAPSFFFIDIPSSEVERFNAFVRGQAPNADLAEVPLLRGRIVRVKDVPAEDVKPDPEAAWVLRGDRGVTFAARVPEGSTVTAGKWWPDNYDGPPLVSFDQRLATGLGLAIGDKITVNVLGRNIEATISNLRTVEWESLGINFVLVFSPNTFRGAPHTVLATLTFPAQAGTETEVALLRKTAEAFPAITTVRVKEALDAINALVSDLAVAVRGAALVTLVASVLVLAGALAASHHNRVYDAVILKTLGATRGRLVLAYGLEYAILGFVTAIVATAAGAVAAAYVVANVMRFRFEFEPWAAALAAGVALLLTVTFGLIGTWRALGEKPARILRNL
ncbi:MAG TPA: FtsX-like permease family protein [Xanthobacteraceae bacterium]|nr:FtsX-like permease family protein [Xanthobacteraceae bacterium]